MLDAGGTGSWNPSSLTTWTCLSFVVSMVPKLHQFWAMRKWQSNQKRLLVNRSIIIINCFPIMATWSLFCSIHRGTASVRGADHVSNSFTTTTMLSSLLSLPSSSSSSSSSFQDYDGLNTFFVNIFLSKISCKRVTHTCNYIAAINELGVRCFWFHKSASCILWIPWRSP